LQLPIATTSPPLTTNAIAFYAYIAHDTPTIILLHPLVFDVVKTNVGNGYHPATGTFITPESGVYVFTWSIRQDGNSHHSTNLMVNTDELGGLYVSGDGGYSTGTGVVVAHVNASDDVFIRTNGYAPDNVGIVDSSIAGMSSFAGWKLF
jgi:hypothetical protein